MRVALISDIHGNKTALDVVLNALAKEKLDRIVCLGDIITIGPQPMQVLELLKGSSFEFVMGNHDMALLEMERALELNIAPHLLSSLEWCRDQLSPADLEFLRSFQPMIEIPVGGEDRLLCYHGSPSSNIDNLLPTTPDEELDRHLANCPALILAGGHTHIQMLRQHKGQLVVNAGSVGSAFQSVGVPGIVPTLIPWAEYAVLEWQDGAIHVDLRRAPFDIPMFQDAVAKSDLPVKDWWLEQYC